MSKQPTKQVEFAPIFLAFLKHLAKKYRSVRQDLEPLVERLERGETPGDQVRGTRNPAYKARLRNRDAQRGKSGGYRVIYYLWKPEYVVLLAIYSKTEQVDISPAEIRRLIEEFEQHQS